MSCVRSCCDISTIFMDNTYGTYCIYYIWVDTIASGARAPAQNMLAHRIASCRITPPTTQPPPSKTCLATTYSWCPIYLMWSSRIFSLIGRTSSSQFISWASPQLRCRTFFVPVIAVDRGFSEPSYQGANKYLSGNCLNFARSILQSNDSMSNNCNLRLPFHETRRCMSKYLSKSATKRLPLTTKRAKKGYYKGKGGTSEGRLTSKGKFIADPLKKLQLIVPDLNGFTLKPYIGRTVAKSPPKDQLSLSAGQ